MAARAFAVSVLGGQGRGIDGITATQPPGTAGTPAGPSARPQAADPQAADPAAAAEAAREFFDTSRYDMGSNAVALAGSTTANGRGLLLGNPHYPWHGGRRFWQFQQTVQGELNDSGACLLGTAVINVGYNEKGGLEPHSRHQHPREPAPARPGPGRPDRPPRRRQAGEHDPTDRHRPGGGRRPGHPHPVVDPLRTGGLGPRPEPAPAVDRPDGVRTR